MMMMMMMMMMPCRAHGYAVLCSIFCDGKCR